MRGHKDVTMAVSISPDNRFIASGSNDHTLKIWDMETHQVIKTLHGPAQDVYDVEFSPDGKYLISGSADQSVILWDVKTGEKIHNFIDNEAAVMDLVYHPAGESFYSISYAGDLTRWKIDPEIFVIRYFDQAYHNELSSNPLFEPRRKGESKNT